MALVKVKSKKTTPSSRTSAGLGNVNRGASRSHDDVSEDDLLKLVPGGLVASFVKQKLHDAALEVAGLAAPVRLGRRHARRSRTTSRRSITAS
jgi:hypothetical protein